MRHLIRKPLLPILILAVMVFAVCFLAFFQDGIQRDRAQVEGLYDNTLLTIELLPGAYSSDLLQLQTHKGDFLEALDQVSKTLRVMECDAQLDNRDTRVYGTNDHTWLAQHQDLEVELWESWDWTLFSETNHTIPCIVGMNLFSGLELSLGDTVTVVPMDYTGILTDSNPEVSMVVAGVFSDPTHVMDGGIIVPEEIFLFGPRLLYNSNMMYDCFYRTFVMELDPKYNRDYDTTEEAVEGIVYDLKEFELVSNFRTLRRAVGPLERKLAVQEQLVIPLAALFAMAAMTCTVLLVKSIDTEIFLRLMWGERRIGVFCSLMAAMALWLTVCTAISTAAVGLSAGEDWILWAAGYAGIVSASCVMAAAIPMGRSCVRNLVAFYQSKEGE